MDQELEELVPPVDVREEPPALTEADLPAEEPPPPPQPPPPPPPPPPLAWVGGRVWARKARRTSAVCPRRVGQVQSLAFVCTVWADSCYLQRATSSLGSGGALSVRAAIDPSQPMSLPATYRTP